MTAEASSVDFRQPERNHAVRALQEYPEAFSILSSIQDTANTGFGLVSPLPDFGRRDRRTLSAALFSRSFKAIHCAIDVASRGYHAPALILVRSVLENLLTNWEFLTNQAAVDAMYKGDEKWWRSRRFDSIAKDIDQQLKASGHPAFVLDWWYETYGELSTFAHPRTRAVRLEFDSPGTVLVIAPVWDRAHFELAMMSIMTASRLNLSQMGYFVDIEDDEWRSAAETACEQAKVWIRSQPEHPGAPSADSVGNQVDHPLS